VRTGCVTAFVVTAGVAVPPAASEPRVAVTVTLDATCAIDDPDAVLRAVRIELGDATAAALADPTATRAAVTCADDVAQIRVDEPGTGRVMQRDVPLADVPPGARARTLGVAVTELIAATWVAPPVPPLARAVAVVDPRRVDTETPDPVVAAAPPRSRGELALDVALGERRQANGLALRGGAVRGWLRHGWLELGVGAELAVGERALTTGHIDVQLGSVGALALARVEHERLTVAAGLGASIGIARVEGAFDEAPAPALFGIGDVRGVVLARARATARWSLHLAFEVGTTVAGIETAIDGQIAPVYRGGFAALSTGVGVAF
jgi:hypothetical protein